MTLTRYHARGDLETGAPDATTSERPLFAAYEVPGVVLFVLLAIVTVLSVQHPVLMGVTHSVGLHVAIAALAAVIALGAAYFAIGEFLLYGFLSSLFIGLAFIVFAAGDAGFGLVPLLAGWLRETNWVTYGFGVQRIAGGAFLVGAALLAHRTVPVFRRTRLVVNTVVAAVGMTLLVTAWVYLAPAQPVSMTAQRVLQMTAGAFFFMASLMFRRISRTSRRTWFFWLSFSLILAGFAQLEYAIRAYPLDSVQPGDILRTLFFAGIMFALIGQWTADYRNLRWQARELRAIQVLMTAPTIQDVSSVVEHIVRVVGESLQSEARVLVADRDQRVMRDPLSAHMLQLEAQNGSQQAADEPTRVVAGFNDGPEAQVALGVNLSTSSRRLGMLVAARSAGNEFSSHDLRLLRALGAQASVLLERSLLYEEVAAGAILEERSRLAREIHDGLAQHLAFLKMRVAWLQRSAVPIERKQLKDIESVLETALIEARHAITTLRADAQNTSMREAIQGYVQEFGQVASLTVHMDFEPDVPEVGPKARVELLRVVQETLNNVRKHSHATSVSVTIGHDDTNVEVCIRDDGQGFEVGRSLEGHFGLQIMSERAESVGGKFHVTSAIGAGTEVCICVPWQDSESEHNEGSWLRLVQG
ncbi:MAG: hypothetical protein NVS2B16_05220 [Chloroflexota bacterium]